MMHSVGAARAPFRYMHLPAKPSHAHEPSRRPRDINAPYPRPARNTSRIATTPSLSIRPPTRIHSVPNSEAPGWVWDSNAKKQDEETPPAWIRILRHMEGKEPLFIRHWLTDTDPGLNQSLISSGTTISQLFDQDKWENHRSVQRYTREIFKLPRSTVLRRITKPCTIVTGAGLLLCLWNNFAAPALALKLGLASTALVAWTSTLPHTMLGAAISLLLVFRTNSCHARFSEGRMLWGRIVATTRKWSLVTNNNMPEKYLEQCSTYVKVWTMVTKSHLRSGRTRDDPNDPTSYRDDPSKFVRSHLSQQEADLVLGQRNRPLTMLNYMSALTSQASKKGEICWITHSKMQECIDEFGNCTGGCERLLSTPLPLSYTRHTSRSLFLWLLTMPLSLYQPMGYAMVPALFLMTFILIGIDELAAQIEEPFSILPLTPLTNVVIRETDLLFGTTDTDVSEDSIGATAFEDFDLKPSNPDLKPRAEGDLKSRMYDV